MLIGPVLGHGTYLGAEQLLHLFVTPTSVQQLLDDLWHRHRHRGRPLFEHVPRLIVDPELPGAAVAKYDVHSITVRPSEARLPVLLHEMAHLLTPHAEHGPIWIEAMLQLWEIELHVPRSIALLAGRQLIAA